MSSARRFAWTPQYEPLRKYLVSMSDPDKEPLMFEDFDQRALGKILDDQRKIVEMCHKRNITKGLLKSASSRRPG